MRVKLMIGRSWPCGRLLEAIPGVFLLAAFFLNFTQPARPGSDRWHDRHDHRSLGCSYS